MFYRQFWMWLLLIELVILFFVCPRVGKKEKWIIQDGCITNYVMSEEEIKERQIRIPF